MSNIKELEEILENSGLEIEERTVGKKRKKVSHACVPCRKAHVSCDAGRPCARCIKRNHPHLCVDSVRSRKEIRSLPVPIAPKSFRNIQPKVPTHEPAQQQSQEMNFFEIFNSTSSLPMDDPEMIYDGLSLQAGPTMDSNQSAIPSCFSQTNLQELEELFLPQINSSHVCQSRGLAGCQDCAFNIENMLPQPTPIDSNMDAQSMKGSVIMDNNSVADSLQQNYTPLFSPIMNRSMSTTPLLERAFDESRSTMNFPIHSFPAEFHFVDHLHRVLEERGIEIPIASHIIYLVRKLIEGTKKEVPPKFTMNAYINAITLGFPSTPTCIFSPSGLIIECNTPFSNLVAKSKEELIRFCLYSILDMGSTLCILDMAHKCESKEIPGFGRCIFNLQQTNYKSCSLSLTTFTESGSLWIVGQFIPI
jgi:hypothetical protein